jgi:hypothetical protein
MDFDSSAGPESTFGHSRYGGAGVVVRPGAVRTLADEDRGAAPAEVLELDEETEMFTARRHGGIMEHLPRTTA